MKQKVAIIIFSTFISVFAVSAELTEITINGTSKTKDSTIHKIIGYRTGDDINQSAKSEIVQELRKSGLFVNEKILVELNINENTAELKISLQERATTIPIPLVAVSGDDFRAGIFLINSNLAGTGDRLLLGGIYGTNAQAAMINYINTYIGDSSFDFGIRSNFSNGNTEIDLKDTTLEYDSLQAGGGVFIQYNYDNWLFSGGGDAGFLRVEGIPEIKSDTVISFSPVFSIEFDNLTYLDFFHDGLSSKLEMEIDLYDDSFDNSVLIDLSSEWMKSLCSRLLLNTEVESYIFTGDGILSPGISSPLLPNTIHADTVLQGSIGLTAAVLDFSWGYLALPLKYNIGYYDGLSGDSKLFHGPSTGISLYLKKVAIPAISFEYGWNIEAQDGEFRFNIGFQ